MKTSTITVAVLSIATLLSVACGVFIYFRITAKAKDIEWTEYQFGISGVKERKFMAPAPDSTQTTYKDITQDILNATMLVLILLSFPAVLCAVILPWLMDNKRRQLFPNTKPYRWGYFNGFLLFATPIFLVIFSGGDMKPITINAGVYGTLLLAYPLGAGILFRIPIAFVAATFLSFNPIAWIINGVYLYRRRAEFHCMLGYIGEKRRLTLNTSLVVPN